MNHTPYTAEQLAFIRDNYPLMPVSQLQPAFNAAFNQERTLAAIKATCSREGFLSGRTGRFERGQQSWNHGKKGYMPANVSSFKKGNIPANHQRLWSERICSKDGFILIKIPERNPYTGFPTRFKHKHVWLWEYHHGPVPKGKVIAFVDGDKLNVVIENLMAVTRQELLSLNLHDYKNTPAELKPSVLALAKLEAAAGCRTRPGRGRNHHEHH